MDSPASKHKLEVFELNFSRVVRPSGFSAWKNPKVKNAETGRRAVRIIRVPGVRCSKRILDARIDFAVMISE